MNLARTLRDTASAHPERAAVRLGSQQVTYADLDRQVDAATAALQQSGVVPGDRVALMMGNRVSFVVSIYATWRAGAIAVPINTSFTSAEVRHLTTDCRATAFVISRAYIETLTALRGSLPDLRSIFVADAGLDADVGAGMQSWKACVAAAVGTDPGEVTVQDTDLALLAYTSGTTGSPKGAMLTHGQLLENQRQVRDSGAAITADDVVYTALPLFHIYALNVAMGAALSSGATLELVERFDPTSSLHLIEDIGVTVVVGAPPMYVAWSNLPDADRVDLSSIRLATSGASSLSPKILERCRDDLDLDIREGYGLTESGPVVTMSAGLPKGVTGSVGAPVEGVEIRIMDEGAEAETGDPGRVLVRGPNVFSGYWERPAATAEVLRDGWLETGDIGYVDAGLLFLIDRVSDLIIVSGFNVYPIEVEQALITHPDIIQAGVVGVPNPYSGEAVKAFVVLAPGAEITADEVIGHTAGMLARFKQPDAVEFVDELPTMPTGKVRRRLLRHPSAG